MNFVTSANSTWSAMANNPTKPSDIRSINLKPTSKDNSPSDATTTETSLTLGVEVIPYLDMTEHLHGHSRLYLLRSDAGESDPVYAELSTTVRDGDNLDAKTLRTAWAVDPTQQDLVDQLVNAKALEILDSQASVKSVRLILSDKEVAKRCGECGRWESRSDRARLATCSGCKLAW